jgi:hypothetical protein
MKKILIIIVIGFIVYKIFSPDAGSDTMLVSLTDKPLDIILNVR